MFFSVRDESSVHGFWRDGSRRKSSERQRSKQRRIKSRAADFGFSDFRTLGFELDLSYGVYSVTKANFPSLEASTPLDGLLYTADWISVGWNGDAGGETGD